MCSLYKSVNNIQWNDDGKPKLSANSFRNSNEHAVNQTNCDYRTSSSLINCADYRKMISTRSTKKGILIAYK